MPYRMGWYIENEVLYAYCATSLSIEEARSLLVDVNGYAARSDRSVVHAIFDLSTITKPLSLSETARAIRGSMAHPRVGWMITVGEQDKLVKFSASVARQLLRIRQHSFPTLAEALAFLKAEDSAIHWERANPDILSQLGNSPANSQDN